MSKYREPIIPAYPAGNKPIFEEWFSQVYAGCMTDRELIPIWFTSIWVNHDYGNDLVYKQQVQEYVDSLDRNTKWFCITQYDDSVLIDFKDLDVLRFEMSKTEGVMIPLLCQPHPYKFQSDKKWMVNFVGGKTHPIRESANELKDKEGYYISYDLHNIEQYCRVIHESVFTLCYRGYGINSFRIAEALQYNSIPVYISDNFVNPWGLYFNDFGVVLNSRHVQFLHEKLMEIEPKEIIRKQQRCREVYEQYYTFDANLKHIIEYLETEYRNRQSK